MQECTVRPTYTLCPCDQSHVDKRQKNKLPRLYSISVKLQAMSFLARNVPAIRRLLGKFHYIMQNKFKCTGTNLDYQLFLNLLTFCRLEHEWNQHDQHRFQHLHLECSLQPVIKCHSKQITRSISNKLLPFFNSVFDSLNLTTSLSSRSY